MATTRRAVLRSIQWRDLVRLRWWEQVWEVTLPAPWLVASLWCYQHGFVAVGVIASFFFFLTGLRLSHNAQHFCLGLPRWGHHAALFTIGALMLSSGHAVQVTHLHHHRHCLDEDDVEAWPAKLPWWRVLLMGPWFPVSLHLSAWKIGSRAQRAWIGAELGAVLTLVTTALLVPELHALRWHLLAMVAGECLVGFFAVWTVHRGCGPHEHIARTQRGWLKNFMTYSMLYHIEHHLFPAVPTCHLPRLAERLDRAAPGLAEHQVY
jgi:fatty acid desaturase